MPLHRPGDQVHFQVADLENGFFLPHRRAPRERIQPRHQFGKGEGFHKVIVGASFQPLDAVVETGHGGQEDHRRVPPGRAQRPDDGQPVDAGQHTVDDHRVVIPRAGKLQPDRAGRRMVRIVPLLLQPARYVIGGRAVVFDDEHLHCAFPSLSSAVCV